MKSKKLMCLPVGLCLGLLSTAFVHAAETGCIASAQSLFLACGFNVREGYLKGLAVCSDTNSQAKADACVAEVRGGMAGENEQCDEVFAARRALCDKLGNAVHDVGFGEEFAHNFVDPLKIGVTVDPNPWFPLVQGNRWVYEASGVDDEGEEVDETIVVSVTGDVKLIEGIRCLVVRDAVSSDGELVEDTDDWFAQDLQGNVWYCGEISKNYELFEGDEPEVAELVDIEGSWKKAAATVPRRACCCRSRQRRVRSFARRCCLQMPRT